jgi:hypothetical protein
MPRGSGAHLANAETVEKRLQKRAENRKELQNFFIHINDTLRVTRDNYNVIILSKRRTDSGTQYAHPEGYYSLPESVVSIAKEKGATEQEISSYLSKIKGIKVKFDDGDLVMVLPKNFKADPVDLETSEGNKED